MDRLPMGGYFTFSTMFLAVWMSSTCGTTMPCARVGLARMKVLEARDPDDGRDPRALRRD